MPYRRLPKTDQARMSTLDKAILKDGVHHQGKLVISYQLIQKARFLLQRFRQSHKAYRLNYNNQIKSSKDYQNKAKMARLYVSHFIQVLNFSFIRKEIKPELKALYQLDDIDKKSTADLSLDIGVLTWGKRMIAGETLRINKGGIPIYNPTIAKVKVHFDLFEESYHTQKNLQHLTNKALSQMGEMRPEIDQLILDIWNQIEEAFCTLPIDEKVNIASEFGVIYYYRTNEKKLLLETN